ncbi:MAG: transposase [Planctomycetes bacterium]|nr:transposase [Planctomycetota bacterium]
MPDYRRAYAPGGTWFFTVNLLHRDGNDLLVREIELLRSSVRAVRSKYPFRIDAWVVLPEHMHCILTLPRGDSDFSMRWRLIKSKFTTAYLASGGAETARTADEMRQGRRGVWQPRYWEHRIRDLKDYEQHRDYIHLNPVKHGFAQTPAKWPWSSIHEHLKRGELAADWWIHTRVNVPDRE